MLSCFPTSKLSDDTLNDETMKSIAITLARQWNPHDNSYHVNKENLIDNFGGIKNEESTTCIIMDEIEEKKHTSLVTISSL